jgi:hypothetical protein
LFLLKVCSVPFRSVLFSSVLFCFHWKPKYLNYRCIIFSLCCHKMEEYHLMMTNSNIFSRENGAFKRFTITENYMVVVVLVFTPCVTAVRHNELSRARDCHRIGPGQAISCLHFRRELKLLYIPEQMYSENDCWKDFIINHNDNVLHRPGIQPHRPIHSL